MKKMLFYSLQLALTVIFMSAKNWGSTSPKEDALILLFFILFIAFIPFGPLLAFYGASGKSFTRKMLAWMILLIQLVFTFSVIYSHQILLLQASLFGLFLLTLISTYFGWRKRQKKERYS